jgi:hypothetical protein
MAVAAKLAPNELAIAQSVIYASLFDYPLTVDEIHETLVRSTLSVGEVLATYRMSDALRHIIEYRDGFFVPAGRTALIVERRRREALSRTFLEHHRRFLRILCAIPYARMVALSGSIAHLNLDGDGDLDLFVITRGRHVWSVTVAVVMIAKLFRRRRVTCANFVVSDARLALEQQDLFTANQAIHLKPLVGGGVFREFLAANPFVTELYPNFRPSGAWPFGFKQSAAVGKAKAATEWALRAPAFCVETFCRYAYGSYLRRRASSWSSPDQVRLQRDCLKLHTRSHRHSTLERFDAMMREALARLDRIERSSAPAPTIQAPVVRNQRR